MSTILVPCLRVVEALGVVAPAVRRGADLRGEVAHGTVLLHAHAQGLLVPTESKLGLGSGLELGLGLGLGLGSGSGLGFGVIGTSVLVPALAVALERGDFKGLEEVVEENHLLSCEWG